MCKIRREGRISLENSCLIEGQHADSIPIYIGRNGEDGTEAGNTGDFFNEFSLEDHFPHDHLLRSIDRSVDLSSIRAYLAEFYSHTGRPSVDPDLLIRMLLVGYFFGIRTFPTATNCASKFSNSQNDGSQKRGRSTDWRGIDASPAMVEQTLH